jgi:hypothetical protein
MQHKHGAIQYRVKNTISTAIAFPIQQFADRLIK